MCWAVVDLPTPLIPHTIISLTSCMVAPPKYKTFIRLVSVTINYTMSLQTLKDLFSQTPLQTSNHTYGNYPIHKKS